MSRTYRDYFNQTVLTIPDTFIDVKTGDTRQVTSKVIEQIEYHSENNTFLHLIISSLHEYFHKRPVHNQNTGDLLTELLEIKKLLISGAAVPAQAAPFRNNEAGSLSPQEINIKEIADVLEAFSG
ncbi:hypothetical protein [Halobacillus sp. Marseille-Q1614]|uniref:hypothetical protein n=1 Tax=Halobacillus sp. Marseille-Q1614 TaxID=2709134 RepID=UPI00156D91B6